MGTAIRAADIGGAGSVEAGTPAADADGFMAILTAAVSDAREAGKGAGVPQDEAGLGRVDTDGALAAALAALLSAGTPPPDGWQVSPGEGDGVEGAGERAAVHTASGHVASAPGVQFSADAAQQIVSGAAEEAAGNDMIERLARELAVARDPPAMVRAVVNTPAAAAGEASPPGSLPVALHLPAAATAIANVSSAAANGHDKVLHSAVGTPRWSEELGSRLVLMTTRGQHEGSLTLSPEDLGPLEVRISVQQNTAHVWFGAQHADTRAALTEALPRLREMFAEAGLSLGHAGVSQEPPGHRAGDARAAHSPGSPVADAPTEGQAAAPRRHLAASGLLDLYA